jgi:hypothetical protein
VSQHFGVHDGSLATLERGVIERVFVSKYDSADGSFGRPLDVEYDLVQRQLMPFWKQMKKLAFGLTPMTHDQFVESRRRKKMVYANALERLRRRGLRESDYGVATFVKAEKLNLTKKPDPAPRVIQPRAPTYNICVGRYFAPLEKVIYKLVAEIFGNVTIFKGLNALDRGALMHKKWARVPNRVGISFDANRFDQHVSVSMLRWEHAVYDLFYRSRSFRRLLRRQLETKGVGRCWDGIFYYLVYGRRSSGDMNTSLGNCLIMCAMVYSFMNPEVGTPPWGMDEWELCNDGDDCILFLPARYASDFMARFPGFCRSLGFPITLEEPVSELEHVEFCQARPVFDGERWCMVRNPKVCLDKDDCSLKPVRTEAEWNTLRNSVGECGLALAGHMPIFSEYYAALRRGAGSRVDKDNVETGFKMLARGMNMKEVPVSDDARISFFRAFDISPDEQLAVEAYYRGCRPQWREPWKDGHRTLGALGAVMGSCP